jgi:CheY-like chemotaxis protein
VREAGNGEEAIAIWEAWQPHLICMDMRMPIMDGREATRRIRAMEQEKKTIIIALTASSFDEERAEILALGCDDFLRKPFQEHVLFNLLRQYLGVAFVCADGSPGPVARRPDAARLAALPAELQAQLVAALVGLNVSAIANAIEAIRSHDVALSEALAAQARDFDYAQMLELLPVREPAASASGHSLKPE